MKQKRLIVYLIVGFATLLNAVFTFAALAPALALSKVQYGGASVLPYTRWKPKNQGGKAYLLLLREASGTDKGTYDALGGRRDPKEEPKDTASRELSEEAMGLLGNPGTLLTYIDSLGKNTRNVVVNDNKHTVIYITKFSPQSLGNLVSNFYSKRQQLLTNPQANRKFLEKDSIAWVSWQNLEQAIGQAPRNANGQLITPIKVWANVVDAAGKKNAAQIDLRPVFVSSLQSFFKNAQPPILRQGHNPKVKFYTY
ncbi:NUDIX hydrolase [Candidatus Dependentiae bacterium]|nr:NUDIX hydrolase [Candidatus Dependentiae bacterium]